MCLWQCFIDVADVFDVDVDTELDDDIVVEIDGVGVKIDVKAVKGADGNDYYYDSTKSFLN